MLISTGSWALRGACVLALVVPVMVLPGFRVSADRVSRWCRAATIAVTALLLIAYTCLTIAFINNDFSAAYVAANSNSSLPAFYRITAMWGEHEGSLFLWLCLLGVWAATASHRSSALPPRLRAVMLALLCVVIALFGGFVVATADPFATLTLPPPDGEGLNPLLQNPAMAAHPPLLYAAYAGSAIPFTFAFAALLTKQLDRRWFGWLRPFVLAGWLLLTLGIAVGSRWSYAELGWGGWWFWDPVENAALMPWLVATALLHSIAITRARGAAKCGSLLLCIAVFSLSLVGTFVTRAGLTASVHTFATAPERGRLLLAAFGLLILGALIFCCLRANALRTPASYHPASRESFLLLNNIFLVIAAALIFVGTYYPLIADVSVGAPYFEQVLLLPVLPLLFAMCIGIHSAWSRAVSLPMPFRRGGLLTAIAAIAILIAAAGVHGALAVVGVAAGAGIISSTGYCSGDRRRQFWGVRMPDHIGMRMAHSGLGLVVIGITVSSAFGEHTDLALRPLQPVAFAGYELRLTGTRKIAGPNYRATEATLEVRRAGTDIATLLPQRRHYPVRRVILSEAAIDSRWSRDLFAALGNDLGNDSRAVRLQYRPLIRLIWLGSLIMAFGAFVAIVERRLGRQRRAISGS